MPSARKLSETPPWMKGFTGWIEILGKTCVLEIGQLSFIFLFIAGSRQNAIRAYCERHAHGMGTDEHSLMRRDQTQSESPRLPGCAALFHSPRQRAHGRDPENSATRHLLQGLLCHEKPMFNRADTGFHCIDDGCFSICMGHYRKAGSRCMGHDKAELFPAEASGSDPARVRQAHHAGSHDLDDISAGLFKPLNFRCDILPGLYRDSEMRAVAALFTERPPCGKAGHTGSFIALSSDSKPDSLLRTRVAKRRDPCRSSDPQCFRRPDMNVGIDPERGHGLVVPV